MFHALLLKICVLFLGALDTGMHLPQHHIACVCVLSQSALELIRARTCAVSPEVSVLGPTGFGSYPGTRVLCPKCTWVLVRARTGVMSPACVVQKFEVKPFRTLRQKVSLHTHSVPCAHITVHPRIGTMFPIYPYIFVCTRPHLSLSASCCCS